MTFIDYTDAAPGALLDSGLAAPADDPASGAAGALTALEYRVIDLARNDGLQTLRPPRKRGWLARLILGPEPVSPMLANERLEALRRLAVQAWHKGYQLPVSAISQAEAAGYSQDQIGMVIDIIGRFRALNRRLAA